MRESKFQSDLIKELKKRFPGCVIHRNDPQINQGVPDITIFWRDRWAMLECKKSATSPTRPNQPYWVDYYNDMSFAAFIFPENEEEVLNALQHAFSSDRETCVPQS